MDQICLSLLQDASSKIMQFAQHGPRAMCVLSANGAVSNAVLRQESSSGGTVTYEVEGGSQSIDMIIMNLQCLVPNKLCFSLLSR